MLPGRCSEFIFVPCCCQWRVYVTLHHIIQDSGINGKEVALDSTQRSERKKLPIPQRFHELEDVVEVLHHLLHVLFTPLVRNLSTLAHRHRLLFVVLLLLLLLLLVVVVVVVVLVVVVLLVQVQLLLLLVQVQLLLLQVQLLLLQVLLLDLQLQKQHNLQMHVQLAQLVLVVQQLLVVPVQLVQQLLVVLV